MKAYITEDGMLTVNGETPTEKYALNRWFADYTSEDPERNRLCVFGVNQREPVETIKREE